MTIKNSALATAAALGLAAAGTASAELTFEADNGWEFGVGGYVPVFVTYQSFDGDGANVEENEFEVGTGFNPASLNLRVAAPTQNGLDVGAFFQINNHVGVGGNSLGINDGFGSRIARIDISGAFGTVHIGKTFGLFGTPAIGDVGSGMGVGGRTAGAGLATLGRIGAGYFYADFEPQIQYSSNRVNGVGFAAALIQPDGDAQGETDTPRFEGRLDFQNDVLHLWTSGGVQTISDVNAAGDDITLTGIDVGGQVSFGPANLRANYSASSGTDGIVWGNVSLDGNGDELDYNQWYVEATVDPTPVTTVGASYGEGGFDEDGVEDRELIMVFGRYRYTDNLTFMAEVQDHDGGTSGIDSYTAASLGAQLNF